MVALVEAMLTLHRKMAAARTEHEQTLLRRQIEATDRQIDRLVYELYELTEDEIGIVEEAGRD
jgi:cell division protein FtsL